MQLSALEQKAVRDKRSSAENISCGMACGRQVREIPENYLSWDDSFNHQDQRYLNFEFPQKDYINKFRKTFYSYYIFRIFMIFQS